MEKKKRYHKKRKIIIKKSLKPPKKSEIIYEVDKHAEIFNLQDDQKNQEDKDALYNYKENILEKKEDEKDKNDCEKNDAMSTSSNSIDACDFNDIPQNAPEPQNDDDEPNSIIIRNISTNNRNFNNNQENLNINNEEEEHIDLNEESQNDFFAFFNEHEVTHSGTDQDHE